MPALTESLDTGERSASPRGVAVDGAAPPSARSDPRFLTYRLPVDDGARVIEQLRTDLREFDRRRVRQAGWTRRFVPTGLDAVDVALPHGGLPTGAITEILADAPGVGALTLALRIARHPDHRPLIVVDTDGDFYPPAAWQRGLPPDRLIVVRPAHAEQAVWATDQILRCRAVGTVIARLDKVEERRARRLQLAAEQSGSLGLLLRPVRAAARSFAAVQLLVEGVTETQIAAARADRPRWPLNAAEDSAAPEQSGSMTTQPAATLPEERDDLRPGPDPPSSAMLCRITIRKVREGMPVEPLLVDLHHETGAVHLPSVSVHRAAVRIA